jgi:hypothetical protein
MGSWNLRWERTAWPGIYVCGDHCRVRARVVDPRSGRLREVNRILRDTPLESALERRSSLRQELQDLLKDLPRTRVVDFGRYWLGIKEKTIDPGTYERYEAALESHAFKAFGRMEFADLRSMHVPT